MRFIFPSKSDFPVFLSLLACFLFLLYLACTTQMIIVHDAIGYQASGKIIYEGGMKAYLSGTLKREPYFPILIALSMYLADILHCHFYTTLVFLNFLSLILSIFLTLYILKSLRVPNFLSALILLYIGFSPAIITVTFGLFSEIDVLPLIMLTVLLYKRTLNSIFNQKPHLFFFSLLFSLFLIIVTLARAVFELIIPFLLLTPCLLVWSVPKEKRKAVWKPLVVFLLITACLSFSGLFCYKLLNKKMNNHFAITNRGAFALYGNTARRVLPRTPKQLASALAHAPDLGLCPRLFPAEDCAFWGYRISDDLSKAKEASLIQKGLEPDAINSAFIRLSIKKILKNPGQFVYLYFVEILKMFSWEGTNIGSLSYPKWLERIYKFYPFSLSIGLFVLLSSLISFFACFQFLFKNKERLTERSDCLWLIAIFSLMAPYILLHAFFLVLKRYAVPIAPLYLIMIGFTLSRINHQTTDFNKTPIP